MRITLTGRATTDFDGAVLVERDVVVAMRDGVALHCDVFHPDGDERYPVLVIRTPYGRQVPESSGLRDAEYFSAHGYVVVLQDVRGRGDSSGEFYPFKFEGVDSYDTIEWAAALPWSTGVVGTVGQSYMASVQYFAALQRPPHLKAAIPVAGPASLFDNCVYRMGVFELEWMLNYFVALERVGYERVGRSSDVQRIDSYLASTTSVGFLGPERFLAEEAYRYLPLNEWGHRLRSGEPYVAEMLEHTTDGEYWWAMDALRDITAVTVPMFNITSWYDAFLSDPLRVFSRLSGSEKVAPSLRSASRLLVGPWGHLGSPRPYSVPTTGGAGDYDFGPDAAVELHAVELSWLDWQLKGMRPDDDAPVRIFVMGENRWRTESEWPLARTRYTSMFLRSDGHANTLGGDGTLSFDSPADEPADCYVYDPHHPVPTAGGIIGGIRDQRTTEGRADVLVYTSSILATPIEVTGPVRVVLYSTTDAVDTDFTAKLVDVRPDGYAHNVVEGIVRASLRWGLSEAVPVRTDELLELDIDLAATSYVFAAGHRVRLDVSSSNFPRFARNPNTGDSPHEATTLRRARQTVHHSARFPSRVVLPIIDR